MAIEGLSKPLAEMSDRELDEERDRRRRLRAAGRKPDAPITDAERRGLERFESRMRGDDGRELRRWYAALELRPGATLAEVQVRYRELMAKYDPDKHVGNREKHEAAVRLAQELTRAFHGLSAHLARGT